MGPKPKEEEKEPSPREKPKEPNFDQPPVSKEEPRVLSQCECKGVNV